MTQTTELLRSMRCMLKLYEAYTLPVCRENGLSQTEADVLAFLDNNPGLDTASDIVELRMIPKANVSQAVDTLMRRALLSRQQDMKDRRRIHLTLTDAAQSITAQLRQARAAYFERLFSGFTPEQAETLRALNARILQNAQAALAEGSSYAGKQ